MTPHACCVGPPFLWGGWGGENSAFLKRRTSKRDRGVESLPPRHISACCKLHVWPGRALGTPEIRTAVRLVGRVTNKGYKRSSKSRAGAQRWIIPPSPPCATLNNPSHRHFAASS